MPVLHTGVYRPTSSTGKKNGIYANICLFLSYSISQSVSVFGSDGGLAPGDDVCSHDRKQRLGHLDEHQGHIPSEDLD